MLARAHRLTQGRDFSSVVRAGRRAGRPTLVVHLSGAGDRDDPPRLGLVVGRTVGNAVVRNQVKRRLRHVARERIGSLPGGAMLVVRALPHARDASSSALARDLDLALRRLLDGGPA